jgi:hypothetical protein
VHLLVTKTLIFIEMHGTTTTKILKFSYASRCYNTLDNICLPSFLEYSGLINKLPFLIPFTLYNGSLNIYFFFRLLVYSVDSLGTGRSGDRIPVGERLSATVQTGPPTMGTGSFPRVKRLGRGVAYPPHTAPRLKEE